MKIDLLVEFSVMKEDNINDSLSAIQDILVEGEEVNLAYSHIKDRVWFTNKRIIAMDVQGITGTKKEYRTFPYSKISSFSIETAGIFDGDSDFRIWLSGVGIFEIKFRKELDIKKVGQFLSEKILSN
ncbi:MAG: PH domain-containing protein [Marinifilaceae bacterium]|jgi:hypothetical protein|nr:PH domain-containing protein [Marinifilaceae bacterium]